MIVEKYKARGKFVVREVASGSLKGTSRVHRPSDRKNNADPHHEWWQSVLRGGRPEVQTSGQISVVDLFCGSGGLSLGASFAIEAAGRKAAFLAAVDIDDDALQVYGRNFTPSAALRANVASLVDYHVYGRGHVAQLAYEPEIADERLRDLVGKTDLLLAGPPCQGHSNLNNHTRRVDPRNMLYTSVAAIAIALKARMVIIENVPDVLSDKTDVVGTAHTILRHAGYAVSSSVLNAIDLGAAQSRRRHFMIATRTPHYELPLAAAAFKRPAITLREAIGDLVKLKNTSFLDDPGELSAENRARIEYLFKHGLYDLPNKVRPDCHKNGHTYPSVYGRLRWNKPSQTITSGFTSPGRGRYIHPSKKRVITPHEAARIQGFPDSFAFSPNGHAVSRKLLTKWIGDAVPSWLGYAAVLTALSGF